MSSITQVPAMVGMVAETFSDVFPAQSATPQSFTHRHLAHQIMPRHRHAFGVASAARGGGAGGGGGVGAAASPIRRGRTISS